MAVYETALFGGSIFGALDYFGGSFEKGSLFGIKNDKRVFSRSSCRRAV